MKRTNTLIFAYPLLIILILLVIVSLVSSPYFSQGIFFLLGSLCLASLYIVHIIRLKRMLSEMASLIEKQSRELETMHNLVIDKTRDLEKVSTYKSEFLANMSHELRTPLNSALLLSKLLSENKEGNLTDKQVQFCQIIYSSSSDLLALINDILDLSKAEVGKMKLILEDVDLVNFANAITQSFQPLAQDKGLTLHADISEDVPSVFRTDRRRMEQIIKNLLSNACKFTFEGEITLSIKRPKEEINTSTSTLKSQGIIAFSIADTGIGIPKDKQKLIFEAFQQADGTTSKEYGGTGLGLSISREYAKLLGGEIHVESEEGKGSTFTVYLPDTPHVLFDKNKTEDKGFAGKEIRGFTDKGEKQEERETKKNIRTLDSLNDDRRELLVADKSVLLIQSTAKLAKILQRLSQRKGFKTLIAEDGEMGLHLADYYKPNAIILERKIPGMNAVAVVERLTNNPTTRHIPIYFISDFDEPSEIRKMGAAWCLVKPITLDRLKKIFLKIEHCISLHVKNILVIDNDQTQRKSIETLLGMTDIVITSVGSGGEAYTQLTSGAFDYVVQELELPDMTGVDLLIKIRAHEALRYIPIIIYTRKKLTKNEKIVINNYAEQIIIKGAKSPERLLHATIKFLHFREAQLPEEQRKMFGKIHNSESILKNKKILIVDDDMRNVFALTSILEENGMNILVGKNGKEGLRCLNNTPDIDLVLMDIMMPVMNGYTAMKEIRKQNRLEKLPVIALTAKAMRGDRNKCIEAGANDYLAKPVDPEKLLSMLRVWLY
ncbi:MAG: response regulator [bacterium]